MNSYVGMTMVKKEEGQDDYYASVDGAPRHTVVVVCLCVCVFPQKAYQSSFSTSAEN